jgi:hypothetical protein
LAASAVDKVVLGPGVKLEAVHNTKRAVNSAGVIKGLNAQALDFT